MRVKQYGVQMLKIKVEFLYNSITKKTGVFVWRGMHLLHSEYVDNEIDAYEAEGLVEKFEEMYNNESSRV